MKASVVGVSQQLNSLRVTFDADLFANGQWTPLGTFVLRVIAQAFNEDFYNRSTNRILQINCSHDPHLYTPEQLQTLFDQHSNVPLNVEVTIDPLGKAQNTEDNWVQVPLFVKANLFLTFEDASLLMRHIGRAEVLGPWLGRGSDYPLDGYQQHCQKGTLVVNLEFGKRVAVSDRVAKIERTARLIKLLLNG